MEGLETRRAGGGGGGGAAGVTGVLGATGSGSGIELVYDCVRILLSPFPNEAPGKCKLYSTSSSSKRRRFIDLDELKHKLSISSCKHWLTAIVVQCI